jgi:glycosyltransferase involved in cell wall biosynthesis
MSATVRHIAIVLTGLRLGGAERLIEEQVRLTRDRHPHLRFSLFALPSDGDEISARLEALDCPVTVLRGWPVSRLAQCLERENIDLVHAHLPRAGLVARAAVRLGRRRPLVYTEHNLHRTYQPLIRMLHRTTFGFLDAAVGVSDPVTDELHRTWPRGVETGRISLVRNGVDVAGMLSLRIPVADARATLGIPTNVPVIALVGHFRPEKGHDVLLEALGRITQRNVHVLFVGRDDGVETSVRAHTERLGLAAQVRFLGFRRDVGTVLAAADLLVMPSLREGLPVALLEACAIGTPVVATPAGGISDVILDGATGRLVPIGDAAALAAAIDHALADPVGTHRMAGAASERVATMFSLEAMVDDYARLYERLLTAGGNTAHDD